MVHRMNVEFNQMSRSLVRDQVPVHQPLPHQACHHMAHLVGRVPVPHVVPTDKLGDLPLGVLLSPFRLISWPRVATTVVSGVFDVEIPGYRWRSSWVRYRGWRGPSSPRTTKAALRMVGVRSDEESIDCVMMAGRRRSGVAPLRRTPFHLGQPGRCAMAGRGRGRCPPECKEQIVELVRSGRSPGSLAREFEPSEQTIRNWVKRADLDEGRRSDGLTTEARLELLGLKREVKWLRMERDILRKAAAWFARESDSIPSGGTGS